MLRNLKIFFTLALVACAAAAYADPPARVGRLNYASGAVSFAPAEAPDQWVQAVLNRPLIMGDRLWVDNDSRAEMHVGSTAVRMGPQTSLDVLNLDDQTLQLRLGQGTVQLRVRHLGQSETLEIATPTGAVVIRQPGSYRVSADPQSNVSRVAVNFGQAEVVTPAQTLTVPSSQIAVMPAGGDVSFELASYTSGDDFDRWSAERDRREDRIASTRYVSRETTGYEDLDQYGSWRTVPDYGAVWYPASVDTGWAPYRYGHWVWISPWGWTWVDDAPWGFAPFHYGRWVYVGGHWGWAPGRVVARPVYAPALVAFVGGAGWSVAISSGPAVGWFPLGFHEPYIPWFRASPAYVRNVNVTHVTNITNVINIYNNPTNVTNIRYAHRNDPRAVTVVPRNAFTSARPVAQSTVNVAPAQLAQAQVIHAKPPAEPSRSSFAPGRPGHRPPATAVTREVVAVTPPPKPAAQASFAPGGAVSAPRRAEQESRVRVIGRERAHVEPGAKGAPQAGQPARAPQVSAPAPGASNAQRTPTAPGPAAQSKGAAQPPAAPTATQAAPAVPHPPQGARPGMEAPQPGQAHRAERAAGAGAPGERSGPPPAAARGETSKAPPSAVARPPQAAVTQSPTAAPKERAAVPNGPPAAASDNRAADEARARARAVPERREPRTAAPPEPAVRQPVAPERRPAPERPQPPRPESGMSSAPQRAAVIPERPHQRVETAVAPREMPPPRPAPPPRVEPPRPAPLPRAEPPRPRPPVQAEAPRVQPPPPRHETPPQRAQAPQQAAQPAQQNAQSSQRHEEKRRPQ